MMTFRPFVLLCCAFVSSAVASPVGAAPKHKRVVKHAELASRAYPVYQHNPARMIQVRPGQWISSWGCYTDEGYGRIGTCDRREGAN
jgi:hypothetical protein